MTYIAGGKRFATMREAQAYVNWVYQTKGIVLGIERIKS